jgi:phosphate transport system permease protein
MSAPGTLQPAPPEADPLHLWAQRRLPRWAMPATLVATMAVMLGVFAVTPLQGRADYLAATAAVFIVVFVALAWAVEGGRRARDRLAGVAALAGLVLALIPLVAVLGFTLINGLHRFDWVFLTHSMRNVADSDPGGGAYAAIIGTLEQVGIATLIAVPLGLMVSVYLVEYSRGNRFGRTVSTFIDVMTGLPSIIAGLFILSFWVLYLNQGYSGFAGALALVVLMIPVVVRTTEEMLRLVPGPLRESSYALGVRKSRTIMSVVLPTALPGITTGVMLAIARVIGETAPVLLTVFGNDSINFNPFSGPQSSLSLFVFEQAQLPNQTAINRAWAGALTLILIVIILTTLARLITSRNALTRSP